MQGKDQTEITVQFLSFLLQPPSDDIKQHALIRLATEKSLQADLMSLKTGGDYGKSWQQLLIMYQSRHEKRQAWKEKSADFEKIEQALVEQQKELDEIEEKLPKPLKAKKQKKEKVVVPRSKQAVVCVLDLEKKTVKPFGKHPIKAEEKKITAEEQPSAEPPSETADTAELLASLASSTAPVINDPFFLNSQHQITYQKRSAQDKDDAEQDDRTFIEHSYFINALSSSSNRRDGAGDVARKKWAHLSAPTRARPSTKRPMTTDRSNGKSTLKQFFSPHRRTAFVGSSKGHTSKAMKTDDTPLHPSWEASKQAKHQYSIQRSQAKKIVFNHSDDEAT